MKLKMKFGGVKMKYNVKITSSGSGFCYSTKYINYSSKALNLKNV